MKDLIFLKESCDIISKQIKKTCEEKNEHFVIDGIIEPEKYCKAKYQILWILKEANSENNSWSYLDNFKNVSWLKLYGKSLTLRRVIYTTYGILRSCKWHNIPDASNEKAFEPLQEIALINIKKIPGNNKAEPDAIQQAYYQNRELLKLQIEIYDPNIIIFGGTLNFFYKSDFKGLETAKKQKSEYGNVFYETDDKLYIHTWHPAVRGAGFTDENYVMDIISIVESWKNKSI